VIEIGSQSKDSCRRGRACGRSCGLLAYVAMSLTSHVGTGRRCRACDDRFSRLSAAPGGLTAGIRAMGVGAGALKAVPQTAKPSSRYRYAAVTGAPPRSARRAHRCGTRASTDESDEVRGWTASALGRGDELVAMASPAERDPAPCDLGVRSEPWRRSLILSPAGSWLVHDVQHVLAWARRAARGLLSAARPLPDHMGGPMQVNGWRHRPVG